MSADDTNFGAAPRGTVDRPGVVARHEIRLSALDPRSPLQVGNGEFACAVDPTGLQTFPDAYPVEGGGSLLGTMAQWAWHSLPAKRTFSLEETLRSYDTATGPVSYVDLQDDMHDGAKQTEAEAWLRGNPHRLQLATIGLWTGDAAAPRVESLGDADQRLDLWTGTIRSSFTLAGSRYHTTTAAHPERDAVAIEVRGPAGTPVGVRLRFPYGSDAWADACDWHNPAAHSTTLTRVANGWHLERRLDETSYTVVVHGANLELTRLAEHDLVFSAAGTAAVVVEFLPGTAGEERALESITPLTTGQTIAASTRGWEEFWTTGAAVDLSGSSDPRALELERRLVLSQYLTAVNCAGSLPPAETGLLLNSWRGKFHLEMHLFHALHFAAWGRPQLLERSLGWYFRVLESARATAQLQAYSGARWPKQVGPDGRETPSSIGPFLVWQQPHLIYLLEMLHRASPDSGVLERYFPLVRETAEFMASYPAQDEHGFHLGPPIVPAQESYAASRATARDPTFEMAYWSWALDLAADWSERLGLSAPARWRAVAAGMAPPLVRSDTYAALATPPYLVRDDHPSMLAAFGLVPRTALIDPEVMGRTFDAVLEDWDWESTWGWDYSLAAMTATRLGRPADALDALLLDKPKNSFLSNGHNRQTDRLPAYLPGNGGLLLAVALLLGGWDDEPEAVALGPSWTVAHEGFVRLP